MGLGMPRNEPLTRPVLAGTLFLLTLSARGSYPPPTASLPPDRYAWVREPALGDCYGFESADGWRHVADPNAKTGPDGARACGPERANSIAICWDRRTPPRDPALRRQMPLCVYKHVAAAACLLSNYGDEGPNPGRMYTCRRLP
jgi:hypothetical protein